MLLSPPLTANSGFSSPRSLKRSYTDAIDDDTPPPSQPLKKWRYDSSPAHIYQKFCNPDDRFDPSKLVTPPEYAHIPYDPDFGAKVCQQYKKSLTTKRACDAVVEAARRHKYGKEDAFEYSPGSTPDHVRRSYEDRQRQLDREAEDIIANSDSESEVESEVSCDKSWALKKTTYTRKRPQYPVSQVKMDKSVMDSRVKSTQEILRPVYDSSFSYACTLRIYDEKDERTNNDGVGFVSNDCLHTRCKIPDFVRLRRSHRVRHDFRSVHIAAS